MSDYPSAGTSSSNPPSLRQRTTSYSKRPKSQRYSTTSSQQTRDSDSEVSEIHSPVPRRHHLLQAEATPWLRTPSPLSTRNSSPMASTMTKTVSFSSLMEMEVRQSLHSHHHLTDDAATSASRRWARWMSKSNFKSLIIPSSVLGALWIRWVVGLGGYSGFGVAPMFGDYEAQRHWMEITLHLPFREWYTYDLQYWGLDYPPLTAYASWVCGWIAHQINPSWVALDASRGIETPESKVFMRATVLAFDLLIYIPSVILFVREWHASRSRRTQTVALLTLLFQPALILIDSGHFQYNSVMLGFTIQTLNFFHSGHDLLGAVSFVLSLAFKQMALYYSPAVFAYLLGKCFYLGGQAGFQLFTGLAIVTSSTFLILFLPFLNPPSLILQPLIRIFPFARGLFEDKVANFWCASNVIIKWRSWLSGPSLARLATILTLLGFVPSLFGLLRSSWIAGKEHQRQKDLQSNQPAPQSPQQPVSPPTRPSPTPTLPLLPYVLLQTSLTFFLFSFQVHEKSILLPLLPITLLVAGSSPGTSSAVWEWGILVNNVACFSMYPLLYKDGLAVQYVTLIFFWNYLIGYNPIRLQQSFAKLLSMTVYAAILVLHAAEFFIPPPQRLPDIYPVLNVLVSASVFGLAWLWSLKGLLEVSWAIGGLHGSQAVKKLTPTH